MLVHPAYMQDMAGPPAAEDWLTLLEARAERGSAAVVGIHILLAAAAAAVSMGPRGIAVVDKARKPVHTDSAGPAVVLAEAR